MSLAQFESSNAQGLLETLEGLFVLALLLIYTRDAVKAAGDLHAVFAKICLAESVGLLVILEGGVEIVLFVCYMCVCVCVCVCVWSVGK